MRKTWTTLLAAAVLLFGAATGRAQENIVGVVSISSYDNVLKDVAALGEIAGKPGLDQMINALITLQTGGKGLAGVDKSKPWGVLVAMGEGGPSGVTFIPVTNAEALYGALVPVAGGKPEAFEDDVLTFPNAPAPIFVKEQGAWLFVANDPAHLTALPENPAAALGGLDQQYTVAARANVQNIPAPLRAQAVAMMQDSFDSSFERQEGETDEDFQLRRQAGLATLKQLERALDETASITLGFKVDAEAKETYVDLGMTAVPGTLSAKQMAAYQESASEFAGFLKDGAGLQALFNVKSQLSPEDIAQVETQFNAFKERAMNELDREEKLPAEAKTQVKEAVTDLIDAILATVKDGVFDGGAVVYGDEFVNAVAGGRVNDGAKVEAALKKLGKVAEQDPKAPEVKWDAEQYAGYNFHSVKIESPDEGARKVFGEQMEVAAAASPKAVFVAIGADATGAIKAVIDASKAAAGQPQSATRIVLSLAPIMKLAAQAEPNDQNLQVLAQLLSEEQGNDRVVVKTIADDGGVITRFSVDEGVIKVIGAAAGGLGGGGGGF